MTMFYWMLACRQRGRLLLIDILSELVYISMHGKLLLDDIFEQIKDLVEFLPAWVRKFSSGQPSIGIDIVTYTEYCDTEYCEWQISSI